MKAFLLVFLLFCSIIKSHSQRIVMLALDGLSVEGLATASTPHLDELFHSGAMSYNTRAVMPSVTLPNWTSHLTSGGPEQHGVTSNSWRLDNQPFAPQEQDQEGYYPSIFKALKDYLPQAKTAYYYNWANLINSINKKYLDEVTYLDNDEYIANYDKALSFLKAHREKPSLVFLYSVHTDHAGHNHNWMSPEYISAIEEADLVIGHWLKKLKAEGLYKDTHFLLITDHGGTRKTGHGGTSTEEMEVPWGIVGPKVKNIKRLMQPNSNANTAAIIAKVFGIKTLPFSTIGKVPPSLFK